MDTRDLVRSHIGQVLLLLAAFLVRPDGAAWTLARNVPHALTACHEAMVRLITVLADGGITSALLALAITSLFIVYWCVPRFVEHRLHALIKWDQNQRVSTQRAKANRHRNERKRAGSQGKLSTRSKEKSASQSRLQRQTRYDTAPGPANHHCEAEILYAEKKKSLVKGRPQESIEASKSGELNLCMNKAQNKGLSSSAELSSSSEIPENETIALILRGDNCTSIERKTSEGYQRLPANSDSSLTLDDACFDNSGKDVPTKAQLVEEQHDAENGNLLSKKLSSSDMQCYETEATPPMASTDNDGKQVLSVAKENPPLQGLVAEPCKGLEDRQSEPPLGSNNSASDSNQNSMSEFIHLLNEEFPQDSADSLEPEPAGISSHEDIYGMSQGHVTGEWEYATLSQEPRNEWQQKTSRRRDKASKKTTGRLASTTRKNIQANSAETGSESTAFAKVKSVRASSRLKEGKVGAKALERARKMVAQPAPETSWRKVGDHSRLWNEEISSSSTKLPPRLPERDRKKSTECGQRTVMNHGRHDEMQSGNCSGKQIAIPTKVSATKHQGANFVEEAKVPERGKSGEVQEQERPSAERSFFSGRSFSKAVPFQYDNGARESCCNNQAIPHARQPGLTARLPQYQDRSFVALQQLEQQQEQQAQQQLQQQQERVLIEKPVGKTVCKNGLWRFLQSLGLEEYYGNFRAEKLDLETLSMLNLRDLDRLSLPLGPRKRFEKALVSFQTHREQLHLQRRKDSTEFKVDAESSQFVDFQGPERRASVVHQSADCVPKTRQYASVPESVPVAVAAPVHGSSYIPMQFGMSCPTEMHTPAPLALPVNMAPNGLYRCSSLTHSLHHHQHHHPQYFQHQESSQAQRHYSRQHQQHQHQEAQDEDLECEARSAYVKQEELEMEMSRIAKQMSSSVLDFD